MLVYQACRVLLAELVLPEVLGLRVNRIHLILWDSLAHPVQ